MHWRWGSAAVAVHLALAALLFEPTLGWRQSNYTLMVLGEALRTGAGYRDLYLVGAPLHTVTPPAYPSLLALAGIFGGVTVFKLMSAALTAAAVWFTYALARSYMPRTAALLAALIVAVSPAALSASHSILPGALLLLLTLLALWSAAQSAEGRTRTRDTSADSRSWLEAVVVLCASLAFLTELRGMGLLLAVPLYLLLARRRRAAVVAVTSALLVAGLWAVYHARAVPGSPAYFRELLFLGSAVPGGGQVGLADALTSAAANAWARASGVMIAYQAHLPALSTLDTRYVPAGLLITALAILGWARTRSPGLAEVYVTIYGVLAVIGPPEPATATNLLPVLPLVAIYVIAAARWLASVPERKGGYSSRRMRVVGQAMPYAAAILLVAPALADAVRLAPTRFGCLRAYRAGAPCEAESVSNFRDAAIWTRDHTPDDAVVISRQPSMFYWYSGRRGTTYRRSAEPKLVLDALEAAGADFAVIDQLDGTTIRFLSPVVRRWPDRFQRVYETGQPPTMVLRLERPDVIVLSAAWGTPD